jgi:hypothetical protein
MSRSLRPLVRLALFVSLLAVLAAATGCDLVAIDGEGGSSMPRTSAATKPYENPIVNLPRDLREWNWGGGSCVHASTVMHLRWQNAMDLADYWRKTYSGGESYNGLTSKLQRNKVPFYATAGGGGSDVAGDFIRFLETQALQRGTPGRGWFGTFRGDVDVLERCTAERRGGVIFYYPNHSILFCGFIHYDGDNRYSSSADYAIVLDNNRIETFIAIEKSDFIRKWRSYGGVCIVPTIGEPRPPLPWIAQR